MRSVSFYQWEPSLTRRAWPIGSWTQKLRAPDTCFLFFFKDWFVFMCINIWICVCKWITCVQCLKKPNEGVRSPRTVVSQLLAIPWVLGMEPRSSESALNHQAVSPVQAPQRSWALSPLLSLSLQFRGICHFHPVETHSKAKSELMTCNHRSWNWKL